MSGLGRVGAGFNRALGWPVDCSEFVHAGRCEESGDDEGIVGDDCLGGGEIGRLEDDQRPIANDDVELDLVGPAEDLPRVVILVDVQDLDTKTFCQHSSQGMPKGSL